MSIGSSNIYKITSTHNTLYLSVGFWLNFGKIDWTDFQMMLKILRVAIAQILVASRALSSHNGTVNPSVNSVAIANFVELTRIVCMERMSFKRAFENIETIG